MFNFAKKSTVLVLFKAFKMHRMKPKLYLKKYGNYFMRYPHDSASARVANTTYQYFLDFANVNGAELFIARMKVDREDSYAMTLPIVKFKGVGLSLCATKTHIWLSYGEKNGTVDRNVITRFDFDLNRIDSVEQVDRIGKLRYNEENDATYAASESSDGHFDVVKFDSGGTVAKKMRVQERINALAIFEGNVYVVLARKVALALDEHLSAFIGRRALLRGDVNDLAFDSMGNMICSALSGSIFMIAGDETLLFNWTYYIYSLRVTFDDRMVVSFADQNRSRPSFRIF
jgi:hypothetical protein